MLFGSIHCFILIPFYINPQRHWITHASGGIKPKNFIFGRQSYINLTKYSRFSQFLKIKEILELAISQGGANIEYVIVFLLLLNEPNHYGMQSKMLSPI